MGASPAAPPACSGDPAIAVLTPGQYNGAYSKHIFLAEEMGVELVEDTDELGGSIVDFYLR